MLTTTIASTSTTTIAPHEVCVDILDRRATCQGIQYTIADELDSHIVTVSNGCIGCSCGLDRFFLECSHICVVEAQELACAEEATRRAVYVELLGIY